MEGEWGVSREEEVASCPIVQCYSEILFWVFLSELESPVCPHIQQMRSIFCVEASVRHGRGK